MSNRYWRGGSGPFKDTSHWSDVSGGTGGFSFPTSTDNAFFDNNSAGGSYTVDFNSVADVYPCANINISGTRALSFTYSELGYLTIYGTFTNTTSSLSFTQDTNSNIDFVAASGTIDIQTNTAVLPIVKFDSSVTYNLIDNFACFGFNLTRGKISTQGFNITTGYFLSETAFVRELKDTFNMYITGDGISFKNDEATGWFIEPTAKIRFTNTSNTSLTFDSSLNGVLYSTVRFDRGSSTGEIYIKVITDTVFHSLVDTGTGVHSVKFIADASIAVYSFYFNTAPGIISLISDDMTNYIITMLGEGSVECDYLNIDRSTVVPENTWYAGGNSINGVGNSGWIFDIAPFRRFGLAPGF